MRDGVGVPETSQYVVNEAYLMPRRAIHRRIRHRGEHGGPHRPAEVPAPDKV
jgi:hypothetical protein